MTKLDFMRRAIELSRMALSTPGAEPFGAVVIQDGRIVGEGFNRSRANHDPTSHGEIEAIRDACRTLGTVDLHGCELYTNCEPCALCVAAMEIAGISRLYFAASLVQSDRAMQGLATEDRNPIDSRKLRDECGKAVFARAMPAEQLLAEEAVQVIAAWVDGQRKDAASE